MEQKLFTAMKNKAEAKEVDILKETKADKTLVS
jgi:hypothetical protein